MTRRKVTQIDPKTFRKHSKIVEKHTDTLLIVGDRVQTDFGFEINGHVSKHFETGFMRIMPRAMTPVWLHPKKSRVLRVVSGIGSYEVFDGEDRTLAQITAGDEIVIAENTTYRIIAELATLDLYVTQDAKYCASLQEVAPSEALANPSGDVLTSLTREDKYARATPRSSRESRSQKARNAIAESRGQSAQVRNVDPGNFFATAKPGVNAMPVADLDAEGAG